MHPTKHLLPFILIVVFGSCKTSQMKKQIATENAFALYKLGYAQGLHSGFKYCLSNYNLDSAEHAKYIEAEEVWEILNKK